MPRFSLTSLLTTALAILWNKSSYGSPPQPSSYQERNHNQEIPNEFTRRTLIAPSPQHTTLYPFERADDHEFVSDNTHTNTLLVFSSTGAIFSLFKRTLKFELILVQYSTVVYYTIPGTWYLVAAELLGCSISTTTYSTVPRIYVFTSLRRVVHLQIIGYVKSTLVDDISRTTLDVVILMRMLELTQPWFF